MLATSPGGTRVSSGSNSSGSGRSGASTRPRRSASGGADVRRGAATPCGVVLARTVTSGARATCPIFCTGRCRYSLTSETMTGVIAVLIRVPEDQSFEVTMAATTDASAATTSVEKSTPERTSVWALSVPSAMPPTGVVAHRFPVGRAG